MSDKIVTIVNRFKEIENELLKENVIRDTSLYVKLNKEYSNLEPIVTIYREIERLESEVKDNKELLDDPDQEIKRLAKSELAIIEEKLAKANQEFRLLLIPKDPLDEKNIFLEIRAGTGGEEASLFAADLFRMYSKYGERNGWKIEIMSSSVAGMGGYKEIIAKIDGKNAYSKFKFEGGVHRVQRIPETEAQGRIHTSAVTVCVLPEADEVDVKIEEKDIRVDVFRSGGPGGQSVNTTDSAVRITHLPTGIVVSMQDEKSQHKNRAKALKILRSRILEQKTRELQDQRSEARKSMIGSGDRSERIRTYNFPQNRVTDHRIGLTLHKLNTIIDGDLDELISSLLRYHQNEKEKSIF